MLEEPSLSHRVSHPFAGRSGKVLGLPSVALVGKSFPLPLGGAGAAGTHRFWVLVSVVASTLAGAVEDITSQASSVRF